MALVAIATVLLTGLSLLLLEAALLLMFGLASSFALSPDAARLTVGSVRDVGAARAGVLLINPRSGGGAAAPLSWQVRG